MRVFGYELTLTKALPLPPLSPTTRGGWWPIVREPYTGAWQKNDEALNPASVLSNPTVFRCYSLITTDIGKTPLCLVEHDRNGIWTETSNPAFSPVLRRPNPYQNPQQFFEAWVGSKLLYGNAYILKERDDRGVVRARYVLDPLKVKPLIAPDGAVYYELQQNDLAGVANEPRPIVPASEIIHDRWNCLFHPLVGVSPLYAVGGAAIQAGKIQDNSTAFFANNSQPAAIIYLPGTPTDEQIERVKTQWKTARGDLNRGGTAFLTENQKYETVAQTATDSQLTEQSKQIANTIAGAWGVPISMVDSSQQPPYANSEATQLQYRSQCLQTHMTAIENCLDEDVPEPYGHEFDIDVLIWMDTTTKTQAARDAIGSGAMAPNEARSKYFGLPPVPGGDTPYLQQQYQSLEAAAMRDAEPPPAPTPQPAPLIEVPT